MSKLDPKSDASSNALINKYFIQPEAEKLKVSRQEGLFLSGRVKNIEHKPIVSEKDGVTIYRVQTSVEITADGRNYLHSCWSNLNEGEQPIDLERDKFYVFLVGGLKLQRHKDGSYEDKNGNKRDNVVFELTEIRWLEVVDVEIKARPKGETGSSERSASGVAAAPARKTA